MIEPIFASFLSNDLIDVQTEELKRVCYSSEEKLNDGQARPEVFDKEDPAVKHMIGLVEQKFNEVFHRLGYRKDKRLEIFRVWSNVSNNLYIDSPHMHPDSFFSGCLYLNDAVLEGDPEAVGALKLLTPSPISRMKNTREVVEEWNTANSDTLSVYPQKNKLIIFPSWVMHYVTPNKTGSERISIAFDTRVINGSKE